ncbi:MAG: 1-deoxy-D-xylulose-5-phosphate synthase [Candidatus Krumholzibacteriota bacterium]|nr:1-deoxy-D-xylulose-5-phosphate synthase [Candidatus Krumholzibacteriota bacterium]
MTPILESIDSPVDLKRLPAEKLDELAAEIRRYIIEVVSQRGGHLASSLGAVEIAIALHYVFDSPVDKFVWDVGHQTYAHKILTGRRDAFRELRTREGISGFPNIAESEHDVFGVGHASTSISAATGLAAARDIRGEDHFVVSVIGDGALTGGMSFEGINHAGHLKCSRFIIVLNDNEMSISRNVGALARYLTRITTGKLYLQMEKDVWELLGRIPAYGVKARKLAGRIKESIKNLVVPNILFEEFGYRYIGPLDGHDTELLVDTFRNVRKLPGPVLVHVVTRKGKGYRFAENDAERFHGIGSFYKTTGNSRAAAGREKYSDVFGSELSAMAEEDPAVVAVTAAMKEGTGLAGFAGIFPDRFFDVGISEQHAVTFAAGLARSGLKPFVAIYSTFLQRSIDQIIHDSALQRLPVRFALDRAGIVGEDGPTHHGAFDLSYLRMVPRLVLMVPRNGQELRRMMKTALAHDGGPSAIRFPRGAIPAEDAAVDRSPVPIGRGEVLREGGDALVLAVGTMVERAMDAARLLDEEGIGVCVADARFVKPVDGDLIRSRAGDGRLVVTVEESTIVGGFGDAVGQFLDGAEMTNRLVRIGIPDAFVPHGRREELLLEIGLTAEAIARRIAAAVSSVRKGEHGGLV